MFKFGNGKVYHSTERITIPVVIAGQNVLFTPTIIENDIPVLLSKDTMKKANTLNKEGPVKFTTSGHYCIPIGKIVDHNHDEVLKSESILLCDDVNELSDDEK